jgi:hypothetical protein
MRKLDAVGAVAGFLDDLALGRGDGAFVRAAEKVADQPGRHLDRLAADGLAPLLHEQDAIFRR